MIDERLLAVRTLRAEADNLRVACIAAVKTKALLHLAYDQNNPLRLPLDQRILASLAEASLASVKQ